MTKNTVTYFTDDESEFDVVEATDAALHSPPTPTTQNTAFPPPPPLPSKIVESSPAADMEETMEGSSSSSPTLADTARKSTDFETFAVETPTAISAPPLPPKPTTYTQQIDVMSERMSETNMEDSFVSTGNMSESGYSTYSYQDLYSGGKRVYKSLKNHMHMDWGKEKEVLIAVMGMTGSGKTTFISKATGLTDLKIGHDLTSCTSEITVHSTRIDDTIVRFVDTPGFSDTYLSDTEVLEMIADYLAAAYTKDVKLSGIIYLHPISDNRVTHHATKNLEMFRKLTGEKNLKNVVLATSMWDKVTPEEGAKRERELREKFWKILMTFEAKTVKYRGTQASAHEIAGILMDNKPFYLQLQEEMGKNNKALKDTAAGREIMQELVRMKETHQRELTEMKDMIMRTQEEKNEAAVKALEEHYQGMLRDMEKTMRDERRMNDEAVKSLTERIMALENRGMCNIM